MWHFGDVSLCDMYQTYWFAVSVQSLFTLFYCCLQSLMLNPVQVLKHGAEEERSETARLVSPKLTYFVFSCVKRVFCFNFLAI